jgi:hypothetical protein
LAGAQETNKTAGKTSRMICEKDMGVILPKDEGGFLCSVVVLWNPHIVLLLFTSYVCAIKVKT